MRMIIINRSKLLFICFFFLEMLVYLPFIQRGGFGPADELEILDIISNMGYRFIDTLNYYITTSMAPRPLSIIFRTIEFIIFKNNQLFYILFQLSVWMFSMYIIATVLKSLIGPRSFWIFLLFSSFPIFCSFIIYAPYLAIEYGFPTLFSGLSLLAFHRYSLNRNIRTYILGYTSSILAILFSSIIFPLLILAVLLPFLMDLNNIDKVRINIFIKSLIKYLGPLLIIGIIFFIFKVFVTPFFKQGDVYAVSQINTVSVIKAIYYYYAISIEPVLLLFESIRFINFSFTIVVLCFLVYFFYYLLRSSYDNEKISVQKNKREPYNRPFVFSVIICFLVCSGIFFISHQPCATYGWYNRLLMPSFILLSIIISVIVNRLLDTRWLGLIMIISFLWVFSMKLQINNFIQSWELREKIFLDISEKMKVYNHNENINIIACVPFFLKSNYNNEEVFFAKEFFSAGLRIYVNSTFEGNPFCWRSANDKNSYIKFPTLPDSNFIDYSNLWYYKFEEGDKFGSLRRINNKEQLAEVLQNVKEEMINYHPPIFRERIHLYFRSYFL